MNRGRSHRGFTIVEVLIFLATSAVVFVGVASLIGTRQAKTEFTNSARDFEVTIQDIANDVSTGYYSNRQSLSCTTSLFIGNGSGPQGSNQDCIYVGKTITFDNESYFLDTLAGRRLQPGPAQAPVENFDQSGIRVVHQLTEYPKIGRSIRFGCMFFATSPIAVNPTPCNSVSNANKTNKITFMTTFVPNGFQPASSRFISSSIVVQGGDMGVQDNVQSYTIGNTSSNPAGGVFICLQSEASNEYALLQIGGRSGSSTTTTTISGGSCT